MTTIAENRLFLLEILISFVMEIIQCLPYFFSLFPWLLATLFLGTPNTI